MNKFYPFLLLFALFSLSFPCSASPEQERLPLPSAIRNLNKQNPELLRLKNLLDEGQIIPFYQEVDKILRKKNRYQQKDVTFHELTDGLFLCYLVATAPFIDLDNYNNVEWIANNNSVDHHAKDFFTNSIPFFALTDRNSSLPGREEALHFYLSAKALIIKQFHSQVDYAFKATEIYAYMLIDYASKLSDGQEAELFNTTSAKSARSNNAQFIIKSKERGFIRELMTCFPTKAREVRKYLRMAGYGDKEIPALLDRTVGRVPEAAYLYKGLPRQRNEHGGKDSLR